MPRASLDEIWGIPLIPLRRLGRGQASLALKRAFDIIGAAVLLVGGRPAAAGPGRGHLRLQTGRSPLFRQLRVTGAGEQSTILKLRTLTEAPGARTLGRRPGPVHPARALAAGDPPG